MVTSAGTDRVAMVDVVARWPAEKASPDERENVIPNHLGKSSRVRRRLRPDARTARAGVVVAPDGRTAWVANALDDSLTRHRPGEGIGAEARVDLGGPRQITKVRWGERLFHSANITFQQAVRVPLLPPRRPRGRADLRYRGRRDRRQPRGQPDSARHLRYGPLQVGRHQPRRWPRQCGPRLAVFFTRIAPFTPEELSALDLLHHHDSAASEPLPPARARPSRRAAPRQADLRADHTNDGREIPPRTALRHLPFPAVLHRPRKSRRRARSTATTGRGRSTCRT